MVAVRQACQAVSRQRMITPDERHLAIVTTTCRKSNPIANDICARYQSDDVVGGALWFRFHLMRPWLVTSSPAFVTAVSRPSGSHSV